MEGGLSAVVERRSRGCWAPSRRGRGAVRSPGADLRAARRLGEHRRAAPAGRAGLLGVLRVSAAYIFGDMLGDPVADEIFAGAAAGGRRGMTRTAIRDLFGRHRSGDRIGAALALLTTRGGRGWRGSDRRPPAETWFATEMQRHG